MTRYETEPGVFRDDPFAELPKRHFKAIYADPPWPFATWSHKGQGRSGEAHYATMSHSDMQALPVADLAAEDAVLLMWVVQTQLPQALDLIAAWGFNIKSIAFVWAKGAGLPLFPEDQRAQMGKFAPTEAAA